MWASLEGDHNWLNLHTIFPSFLLLAYFPHIFGYSHTPTIIQFLKLCQFSPGHDFTLLSPADPTPVLSVPLFPIPVPGPRLAHPGRLTLLDNILGDHLLPLVQLSV